MGLADVIAGSSDAVPQSHCLGATEYPLRSSFARHSSFAECPNDATPRAIHGVAPPCVDSFGDCDTPEEFAKLRKFSKAVDDSVADHLREAKRYRQIFERRACDYKYAELQEDKEPLFEHIYGPEGPLVPGGSYLYAMRRWVEALHKLKRVCFRATGGCSELISYLREHPEADMTKDGLHGKSGSGVYNEFRTACEVGRSRSPVPNPGPVWCSTRTGLCEQPSCKRWWDALHNAHHLPAGPWVDDRGEYDSLRDTCEWTRYEVKSPAEINEMQRKLALQVQREKEQYCKPRWIEGYCEKKVDKHYYQECHLQGGKMCHKGLVTPGTDLDDTKNWTEEFPEQPVGASDASAPPPLLTLLLSPPSIHSRTGLRPGASNGPSRTRSFLDSFL